MKHFVRKNNIAIVKRTTGGGAVYHKNDITYMFSAPLSYFEDSSVTGSYKKIAEIFLDVFLNLNIPCQFAGTVKREIRKKGMEKGVACFLLPSDYEILADNRKIIGNAQKREGRRLVQHGSIAFDFDFFETAKVLNADELFLRNKVTCLKEYNSQLTVSEFQKIFLKALTDRKLKVNIEENIYKHIDKDFLIELKGRFPLL
jgi:lipoate-protein ligase A